MRWIKWGRMAGAGLLVATLGGCGGDEFGYVEVKLTPAQAQPPIVLDGNRIDAKSASNVYKQKVGNVRLQYERHGALIAVCEITVRKDRIVTVAVTGSGRDLRCQIQN